MADIVQLTQDTTKDGDRWDTLAFRAYADVNNISPLIAANPGIPLTGRIPGGITFYIPILTNNQNTTIPQEQLPPWKRS